MRGTETITVKPQVKVDKLRGSSGPAPEPYDIEGCKSWPLASHEEGKGWVGIDGKGVLCPAGSVVPASAIVTLKGEDYEVRGFPQDFGRKGIILTLTRVGRT